MVLTTRRALARDAAECGRICFEAFAAIADHHRFTRDFASIAAATDLVASLINHGQFFGIVAERDGRIVGSNFLDERCTIASVGPVTIDPIFQDHGIGRELMTSVLNRAKMLQAPAVRLMQAAYHNRSLSLYAKVGFAVRDSFAVMQGVPHDRSISTADVRSARLSDLRTCDVLCRRIHGEDRHGEVADSIATRSARVLIRDGRLVAYTTGVGLFGHSVAETTGDLQVLIEDADDYPGSGFLVPMHNDELLRWCLGRGLRIVYTMNLMTIGRYQQPRGAFLASVGY